MMNAGMIALMKDTSVLLACFMRADHHKVNAFWVLIGIGNYDIKMLDSVFVRNKKRITGIHDCAPNIFSCHSISAWRSRTLSINSVLF